MNIKDPETERLAAEVAALTGETKTGAIKGALLERRSRLVTGRTSEARKERLRRFLDNEVWPQVSPAVLGTPTSKAEREEILGYGPAGV
jgi:antitoxin VapB